MEKIFAVGLNKTGTRSLKYALEKKKLNVYIIQENLVFLQKKIYWKIIKY